LGKVDGEVLDNNKKKTTSGRFFSGISKEDEG
jgi:hypothetical protein